MIVVDSSAIVAILLKEVDASRFRARLATGEALSMSAVNVHETAAVLYARLGEVVEEFWRLLSELRVKIVPFDEDQARAASAAYARCGKGLGSKAQLNLYGCAAYAPSKTSDSPLLFKGEDFTHTDLACCL